MLFNNIVLEGDHVRLEPVSEGHKTGLIDAITDGELWNLFVTTVPMPSEIESFIEFAHTDYEAQRGLAFATIDKASGKVVGSTRFMKADFKHKKVEIGFTFISRSFQKTMINTEAKLLMLTHAFERLNLNRVEFLTDYLNNNSRNAILRLGAKEEGVLRSHMIMRDGRVRDSVIFSVTNHDWNGVKQNLLRKLMLSYE